MKLIKAILFIYFLCFTIISCKKSDINDNEESIINKTLKQQKNENIIYICGDEWMPFQGNINSDKPGYMVEVVNNIYKNTPYKIVYKTMPWNRSLLEVKNGRCTAVIGTSKKEARGLIFPEEEFYILDYIRFYVNSDNNWKYTGIKSLEHFTLGYIKGYGYSDEISNYIEKNKKTDKISATHGNDPLKKLIKKLIARRIDIAISSPHSMLWKLKTMGYSSNIITDAGFYKKSRQTIYMAFTPAQKISRKQSEIFTKGMRNLRKSGVLKILLKKYELPDWK